MKKVIKQCVGIDVSQNEIDVTFGTYDLEQNVEFLKSRKFKNSAKSFCEFLKWAVKLSTPGVNLVFVMEATGVYHENLACFLNDSGQKISVVLPNRASLYAKSLEIKTITDKEASKSLTRMGLEKKLDFWVKPDPIFNLLKQLTREREQLQKAKTVCSNQIHAEIKSAWTNNESIKRAKKRIKILEDQIKEIEKEIDKVIKNNPEVKRKTEFLTSLVGVGTITAAIVMGETNGFQLMENKRQLVSYSGYDVIRKDSGTSVHSKSRISKRGNRHIRKAMHLPALCAIRNDQNSKIQFKELVQKHGIKMKAAVAIQRKLLVLMYTLWKKEQYYDPNFISQNQKNRATEVALN